MTESILQASALTVLVLILRRLLRGRVSQWVIYLLWLPVLVRLALPGVFFTLPVGAQGAVTQTAERLQTVMAGLSMEPVRVSGAAEAPGTVRYAAVDVQGFFVTVWNLGAVLLLAWVLAANLRFARALRRDRVLLPGCGGLPVYAVPALASPCLALSGGRLGIYIPEAFAADPERLRHILAHETAHARHFDHIWELLRLWVSVLYWWNPLVWLAVSCSRQDGELACDEAAMRMLGEPERFRYGRTLVELAERCADRRHFMGAASMSRGGRALRERVRQVAHRPKLSRAAALLAALLLTLGSASAFTTVSASGGPFEGAVIYTGTEPAHGPMESSSHGGHMSAGEVAKGYFDVYVGQLQAHWAASGYPLEEVVLFDLNVSSPDAPAGNAIEFTPVYAVRPKGSPPRASKDLSGLLDGFAPGYGALEGYLLAAGPMAAARGADGGWEAAEPATGLPAPRGGYRSLSLEEVYEYAGLKGPSACFSDFLGRYHAEEGGNHYIQSYNLSDAACTLHTARRSEADAGLYLVLVNRETGASADLREGLSAVRAVAGKPAGPIWTQSDIDAAAAVVEGFIAAHPVWQDAEIRYDPYVNRLNQDIHQGVYEQGYTKENVITLLCDFTAGEGPVLVPGERYTGYQFILARRSGQDSWEIVDMGY